MLSSCWFSDSLLVPVAALKPPIRLPAPLVMAEGNEAAVSGGIPKSVGLDVMTGAVEELAVRIKCHASVLATPSEDRLGCEPPMTVFSELPESKADPLVIQLGTFKCKESPGIEG